MAAAGAAATSVAMVWKACRGRAFGFRVATTAEMQRWQGDMLDVAVVAGDLVTAAGPPDGCGSEDASTTGFVLVATAAWAMAWCLSR